MYLVTGAAGFCGFHIVRYLLQKQENVRAVDVECLPTTQDQVEFFQTDICDQEKLTQAFKGVDVVIHAAAKIPVSKAGDDFRRVNVDGTRNVCAAALKNNIKKVVYLSSSSVQGTSHMPAQEDDPYDPIGPYAQSKMEAEKVCNEFTAQGLSIDIIRPRTIVGKERLGIFHILFDWIERGKKIYIIGDGENKIQFLHVEDLVDCCYLASKNRASNTYNIGAKTFASLREDLSYLVSHAKTTSKIVSLPAKPTIVLLGLLDQLRLSPLAPWHYLTYHKDFYFTNEKANEILGWNPKWGNKESLIQAYDWYVSQSKEEKKTYGTTHKKPVDQKILNLLKRFS